MYKSGPNRISKPHAKSRGRFNIEIGEHLFGIGVHEKIVKSTSHTGPHWMDPEKDDMDEVVMLDDGSVLYCVAHKDN